VKILVLHKLPVLKSMSLVSVRETELIFSQYASQNTIVEANYRISDSNKIFDFPWDVIVLTSTTLDERVSTESLEKLKIFLAPLKNHDAYKVAMPQDEYYCIDDLDNLLNYIELDLLVTLFYKDRGFLYPKITSNLNCNVIQGQAVYFTPRYKNLRKKFYKQMDKRAYDVVYKATTNLVFPNNLGIQKALLDRNFDRSIKLNSLKTNFPKGKKLISGANWFRLISNSKSILGSNSGSDLIIRNSVLADLFKKKYAELSVKEREQSINELYFDGIEKAQNPLTAISPRNIDAASVGTVQILVGGSYSNILKPGIDYLETDFNFSNVEYLLESLHNFKFLGDLTENAWNTISNSSDLKFDKIFKFILDKASLKKSLKNQPYLSEPKIKIFSHAISQLIRKEIYLFKKGIHSLF
jgi:hypothetical protein